MFGAAGRPDLALEMYTDLRRFEEAKAWAEKASLIGVGALSLKSGIKSPAGKGAGGFKGAGGGISVSAEKELESKAAEWNEESNHLNVAVDMYIKAGKFDKAITIIAKQQWADKLTTILKQLGALREARKKRLTKHLRKIVTGQSHSAACMDHCGGMSGTLPHDCTPIP